MRSAFGVCILDRWENRLNIAGMEVEVRIKILHGRVY